MTAIEAGRQRIVYALARGAIVFVWLYHGAVPKLIVRHPDEYAPLLGAGFTQERAHAMVTFAGWAEIAFGLVMLLLWRARWPFYLSIALMLVALSGVTMTAPQLLTAAFNPLTLNLLVIVLALIGLTTAERAPAAAQTKR